MKYSEMIKILEENPKARFIGKQKGREIEVGLGSHESFGITKVLLITKSKRDSDCVGKEFTYNEFTAKYDFEEIPEPMTFTEALNKAIKEDKMLKNSEWSKYYVPREAMEQLVEYDLNEDFKNIIEGKWYVK